MAKTPLETLFLRYRDQHDLTALAQVFDRTAPQLLALARRLSGGLAEDLVQETFLAVIENSGAWDGRKPLVPWLLGILTHRAQRAWAKEGRSIDPERLVVREVEQPDEALTASELHAQVEHALKDLTPALQQAVRGSLFDGKSPTQLAVDLGLDSGTIRQRLFRGMSQLRLLLKGAVLVLFALFGLRSQGLAGVRKQVLHEAARASAGGATGLAAASWPGRMVMVLVVASLCWVGAKALWPAQDAEMREQGGMELAGISSDHGVDSNPVTELVGMAATEARAVTAKQFVFAAQLVWDTTGEPISGREVSLSLYSGEKASETSGTDGRVSFPFTPSDKPWRLSAISTPQSLGASLFIGRSDPNELLVVRLSRGGSLSGTVVDAQGNPVPNATVLGWSGYRRGGDPDRRVEADGEGEFTVEHLGKRFVLTASSTELVCARGLHGDVLPGQTLVDHKIRLAKPVEFVGRVRTPSGGPVVGVEVKSTDGSGSFGGWGRTHDDSVEPFLAGSGVATTDEQGRFVLGGLSPASRSMHVAHEPFLGYHEYHHHDRGEIEIELVEGESIEGDVRGRIGEIIPGAQVAFWPHYAGSVTTPKWNSPDPETGHFAIRGIEPYESYGGSTPKMSGKNRGVIFRAPGYAVEVITPVPTDLSELTPLQVRMSPEKRIEGRAVDSNGNPKVGLRVRIEGDRTYESNMSDGFAHTWEKLIQKNITHTDEQGVFSFDQLYPGRFSVRVYSGSSEQGSIAKTTVSGGPPLEFVMDEQLIRGVVVLPTVADKLTGEPITNYTLLQWVGDTGYHRTVTEGVNGPEVAGLEPGRWGLGITADGYVSERLKDKTYALGEYPVEFQLAPVRSLEVKVLLPDGTSPPHVIVHGVDSDGSKLMFDQGGSSSTRTQLNSAVRHLHGLPARSVELTFGSDRFGATVSVDLQESWSKPLVVHLRAVGPPPQKPTLAYMAIWELKPLEAGEDAGLLPMSMPRVMRETQQSDIDTLIERVGRHRLISPIHPFAIVIDTPAGEESAGVRWEYISEEDAEVFTPHKEEEGPSRDRLKAKVEKALGPLAEQQGGPFLRLACNWRIGGRKSGSATVPRLAWSNSPRGIELKSGLALEPYFETRPGECSLRLTSDHYEPIELTWYPGQRKEGDPLPILLLVPKK